MKTSLKKLQKFAALRHEKKGHKHLQSLDFDELARATQDMLDMRDCYDKLLSAAAATVYMVEYQTDFTPVMIDRDKLFPFYPLVCVKAVTFEFSESLKEMGDCLLEKTSLNDDEESGKVLLKMGKVQFELQKLVDAYRSHIFQTITVPSECLLNELQIVEEMKRRCDGKREIYDDLLKKQKEKGRLRSPKGDCFPSHQLQAAHDDFDEEVNVFVFRMKSLKQGQSRSLLTQASRHHAAQLCFFKKALSCLEAIDPHVRLVAEEHHIDYQFNGLKEDSGETYDDDDDDDDDDDESDGDEDDDTDDDSESHDGELSFDYGQLGPVREASSVKSSMELDDASATLSPDAKLGVAKESLHSPARNSFSFRRQVRAISKSAPLFPEKRLDATERLEKMRALPSQRFTSYALPTPDETKIPASEKLGNAPSETRQSTDNPWHSSPLDQNKYEKLKANMKFSGPIILDTQSVLKESNNIRVGRSPPPLSEGLSFKRIDPSGASYAKRVKRQAFSGPLTGKPWSNNRSFSSNSPIASSGLPPFSGSLLRTPLPGPASTPKMSSHVSPTFMSSPKISELHELPRPPPHLAARRASNRITQSGPLMSKRPELSSTGVSIAASTLPMPPPELPRSYSIPAGGPNQAALRAPLESSQNTKTAEDMFSPPLTPISLPLIQPASPTS